MKKTISYFVLILAVIFLTGCTEKKDEQISPDNSPIFFALFGIKYAEKDKNPVFDSENIKTQRDKKKFDKQLRAKVIELLNFPLIPLKKPKIENIQEVDKGLYTEEKIFIYTSKITGRYAYLLKPKNINYPAPTILAMHAHNGNYDFGKDEVVGNIGDPDMFYAKELAERGYIVFALDAPLFGDSSITKISNTTNDPRLVEEILTQHLLLLGHPPIGAMIQEELISLDYLTSLDIVDKNHIGCIGHSMGGIRCLYLAAIDERIKATVLSGSVANLKLNPESGILHTWLIILPGIGKYAGMRGLLALIAPRPLLILYSEFDPIFPLVEAQDKVNLTKELYTKLNKQENFESIFIPKKGHAFPQEYHEQAYKFLDKHLKNN